jgi:phage anti-repressor protein
MKQGVSLPNTSKLDKDILVSNGFLVIENSKYKLTVKAKGIISKLDNYFIKAKKKTDIQLMGKDFATKINTFREIFPNQRLPSGKPARVNVKMLSESFRWFFETYDYEWANVIKATKMYVNEYRDAEYMYMQTSQYFICKQDKHRVKSSTLADYCDMIRDGIDTEEKTFKEKVV